MIRKQKYYFLKIFLAGMVAWENRCTLQLGNSLRILRRGKQRKVDEQDGLEFPLDKVQQNKYIDEPSGQRSYVSMMPKRIMTEEPTLASNCVQTSRDTGARQNEIRRGG